ncbi:hypothetical protein [Streptomyces sp. NPDC102476]|uniref:hypothetical protein n=1 Tax=Streptomyces sp. NPDC102476 TaxID=3366181 RepID=UPI0038055ED4
MSISTSTAYDVANATIAAVLLVFGVWTVRFCYRRARAADALTERILRETPAPGTTVWDDDAQQWLTLPPGVQPGPSQYTGEDVAALDRLVLAWDAPAFDPATDPQWAAARARLLADLNNDQQGDPQ